MIATYFTERGTTVGLLEQLFGSTTVASTLKTQLMLRQYNFVAVLLLLLWSLSPLGGQGVLRLITVADQRVVAPARSTISLQTQLQFLFMTPDM
jgi:hypothetical protein